MCYIMDNLSVNIVMCVFSIPPLSTLSPSFFSYIVHLILVLSLYSSAASLSSVAFFSSASLFVYASSFTSLSSFSSFSLHPLSSHPRPSVLSPAPTASSPPPPPPPPPPSFPPLPP